MAGGSSLINSTNWLYTSTVVEQQVNGPHEWSREKLVCLHRSSVHHLYWSNSVTVSSMTPLCRQFKLYCWTGCSMVLYWICTAVFCGSPPSADYTTSSSTVAQIQLDPSNGLYPYGTTVEYACLDGRKFTDGMTTKGVTCVNDAVWSEDNLICDCKFHITERVGTDYFFVRTGVNIPVYAS